MLRRALSLVLLAVSMGWAQADVMTSKLSLLPSSISIRESSFNPTGRLQLEPLPLRLTLSRTRMAIPPGNFPLRLRGGAKSKNHTNHNQNRKAHRNGIKHRHTSMKLRDVKVWRNERYARKGSMRVYKQKLDAKKALARGKNPFSPKHKGKGVAERARKARVRNGGEMDDDEEEERELYRSPSSLEDDDDDDDDNDDDEEDEEEEE